MGQVRELRRALGGGGGTGAGGEPPDDGWNRATPEDPAERRRLPDWFAELDLTKKNEPENTVANATAILQRSPEWRGLRFDEFRSEPVCTGFPDVPLIDRPKDGPLDDYGVTHITQWLALNFGVRLGTRSVAEAAESASKAKGRAFHPVREYLRGLEWDSVKRIDSWLSTYAGVPASAYAAAVGRMWLISAVARAMQKRAIVKSMLILEGPQNAGKSTLLRTLCPNEEWFSDTPIDLGKAGADKYQALRGKWIVEIPELDGFRGKDSRSIKSFVSSPVDNYRASYGKKNQDVPRQCVFAGTTNEDRYLQDKTGNVRFWPVRITRASLSELERDRDQLWAEAMACYQDMHHWHITDETLAKLAREEVEKREEDDPWMGALVGWLRTPVGRLNALGGVTNDEVLQLAMNMPKERQDKGAQTRLGILMRDIGFKEVPGRHRPRLYTITEDAIAALGPGKQAAAQPSLIDDDFGPENYP